MGSMIVPLILFLVLIIFGVTFFVITKKQGNKSDDKNNNSSSKKNEDSSQNVKKEDVFNFMEFDKLIDNMIVQNNGQKYTMAIKCKGINYELMSEVEQMSVEEGFITFLNTLRFPIQLYVQAQNIDLKGVIAKYKVNVDGIRQEYEKVNDEYMKTADSFGVDEDESSGIEKDRTSLLNVYEYANDIIKYVERLSLNKNLLQRNFYIIFSYHVAEITSASTFSKSELQEVCYNELFTRAQAIISALASCSVEGRLLESNELADLLYIGYNRDDKGLLNVSEAINSGFYRLYSTSEDVFERKNQKLIEQIENEAKIKAAEALKKAIEDGNYLSEKEQETVIQEKISKEAYDMVAKENIPEDIKKDAQKKIVNDYRKLKKEILNKNSENKEKEEEKVTTNTENNKKIDEEKNIISEEKIEKTNNEVAQKIEEPTSNIVIEEKNQVGNTKEVTQSVDNDFSNSRLDDRFGPAEDINNDIEQNKLDNEKKEDDNNSSSEDDLII